MTVTGQAITTTLAANGTLTVALVEETLPEPTGHDILVKVEAAPINPSDLALLFGPADLAGAEYSPGKIVARMPEAAMPLLAGRVGQAMRVGNEGAGTVIAAGEEADAQSLLGTRVACVPGGMFAQYRIADARACLPLPKEVSAEAGAAAFVNPLTVLGFVETMRRDGFTGIVHAAAASNLGQMLAKVCAEEGIPLVNVVRSPAQVALLKGIGAEHVLDSTAEDFDAALTEAIRATGAMLAFDPIGGGKQAGRIFSAMERVASAGLPYNRYGSDAAKKVYIYGALDHGPTILNRTFGFSWTLSGWLLFPFLQHIGVHGQERLRHRVLDGLTTTFASSYKAKISLAGMLERETALAYNAKATGEKYLIEPWG